MALYFVQAGDNGPVKIGYSRSPKNRIMTLGTARADRLTVLAITDGDRAAEKAAHARFAHLLQRNEWFSPSEELLAYCRSLPPALESLVGKRPKTQDVKQSSSSYRRRTRVEVAAAFATALRERFAENPSLRSSLIPPCTSKTIGKWESGESLPGMMTACKVLTAIEGWEIFARHLDGDDYSPLVFALDRATAELGSARESLQEETPSHDEVDHAEDGLDVIGFIMLALRRRLRRSMAPHQTVRERQQAEHRLDDMHDAMGRLRRDLRRHPADERSELGSRRGGCVMPRYPCPVCGDPSAFPLWADDEPPAGCPADDEWLMHGRAPAIRSVTECGWQLGKAWQAREFRRLVPDAFDDNGLMKAGQLARVLDAFHAAHPTKQLII